MYKMSNLIRFDKKPYYFRSSLHLRDTVQLRRTKTVWQRKSLTLIDG